jgi:hypothetical protein
MVPRAGEAARRALTMTLSAHPVIVVTFPVIVVTFMHQS